MRVGKMKCFNQVKELKPKFQSTPKLSEYDIQFNDKDFVKILH